jgi:hypothetical protein
VEICVNDDDAPLLICRIPAPIEDLSLGQLLRCVSKLRMRSGFIENSPFQIFYRNGENGRMPVTNQFPYDTDYSWNRLCLSKFWVAPRVANGIDRVCKIPDSVWHFVETDNTLKITEWMGGPVL